VVHSRGVRREFELVSLLRRGGRRFGKFTVREGSALDGVTLGEARVRDAYAVVVFAVRHEGTWQLTPRGSQPVAAGDDLFAVGSRETLGAFEEAVA
jgi:Trk K+ transport system NAD-binding subunit